MGLGTYNRFRFHTGSIKSMPLDMKKFEEILFRFHTGSIKRLRLADNTNGASTVSIPYWFD